MDLDLSLSETRCDWWYRIRRISGSKGLLGRKVEVANLDIRDPRYPQATISLQFISCDVSSEESLESAFAQATDRFGTVACCIALASLNFSVLPHHDSLADMDVEQWRKTHKTNVEGTFLTAATWLR